MTPLFEPLPALKIGKIVEVHGNSLRIELDSQMIELTRSIDGRVYPIGQIASIIKVHFGRKILFAYVRLLRMRSEIAAEEGQGKISPGDDARILEADLFAQGAWNSSKQFLAFERGLETYPLPLQGVFLCLDAELQEIYRGAEAAAEAQAASPMIPIGNYIGNSTAVCRANMDKLFGHHCAILGSTGSGKSGAVATILHSVLEHTHNGNSLKPRIVVIDPHGEYTRAFGTKAKVYRAYNEAAAGTEGTEQLKLPYWLMSGDEFRSFVIGKTEFEATSQNNIVYEALAYARMVQAGLIESAGTEPRGGATPTLKAGITEDDLLNFDRDKPRPFKLSEFVTHIDKVQGRKPGETNSLSVTARDAHDSILRKLRVLRGNPQLKFMMSELGATPETLKDILSQFVGGADDRHLRVVDISGLPNEAAGPLTALISRLLFQYKVWQTRDEREVDPVLLVCEEAHRYVPNHGEAQYREAQQAIRRIAKEGRKYGLGLALVSQRPADVEGTVLSQCNTWLVLRLTNSHDQEHVAKFLPDSLKGLTGMLSSMTRREALFVGEAAALPSRIRITRLSKAKLPDSQDISFVNGWLLVPENDNRLDPVVARWTKL